MDEALKPSSRSLYSVGTVGVALLIAANLILILWLNGSSVEDVELSSADAFPQQIKLLDELDPGIRRAPANEGDVPSTGIETSRSALVIAGTPSRGTPAESAPVDPGLDASSSGDQKSAQPQALACRVWGPIGAQEVLDELRSLIGAAGDVIDVQASEIASDPDYLVYIETDQNIDNARRLLKELESQSVDAYVISGGELINSVSVGVFSRQSRAEAHQQRLKDMGYQSLIEPLERGQTVYHLYARVPQGFETVGHASADCATIASLR